MTRKIMFLSVLLCVLAMGAWSSEVYCRYQTDAGVFYGKAEGDIIHQLCAAPWDGGKETGHTIAVDKVKLLHPSEPKKVIGLSGAYKDNWTDGNKPLKTIRWFLKPPTSAASPGEDVVLPGSLDTLMVETELVIVIGKRIKDGSIAEAKEAIFGYTVGNDIVGEVTSYHRVVGEPLDQEEVLLNFGLKQCDGFAPYGPFIHKGADWRNRERTLKVITPSTGKEINYSHNTSNLAYTPEKIVSDLSHVFSFDPGDVIFTATTKALPAHAGDLMIVGIEGLGTIKNRVKAAK